MYLCFLYVPYIYLLFYVSLINIIIIKKNVIENKKETVMQIYNEFEILKFFRFFLTTVRL